MQLHVRLQPDAFEYVTREPLIWVAFERLFQVRQVEIGRERSAVLEGHAEVAHQVPAVPDPAARTGRVLLLADHQCGRPVSSIALGPVVLDALQIAAHGLHPLIDLSLRREAQQVGRRARSKALAVRWHRHCRLRHARQPRQLVYGERPRVELQG